MIGGVDTVSVLVSIDETIFIKEQLPCYRNISFPWNEALRQICERGKPCFTFGKPSSERLVVTEVSLSAPLIVDSHLERV